MRKQEVPLLVRLWYTSPLTRAGIRAEWCEYWKGRARALRGIVSDECILRLLRLTRKENIGYGHGQVRPDERGRWDLFFLLGLKMGYEEAFIVTDLGEGMVWEKAQSLIADAFRLSRIELFRKYPELQALLRQVVW